MLRWLALLLWMAGCLLCSASAAPREEKKAPLPTPPPQAVEQKVEVPRGQAVKIPLKIYGTQRETLRFLIRTRPEHGELTAPTPLSKESAMVTYTPPADYDVTEDQFTYAVGNSAGVSAAAAVTIRIVDEPSLLAIPGALQFAPLLAGKKEPQEFEITNRGGGVAEGEIRVDPPWQIEGEPEYRLPAGMSQKLRVIFAPTEAGTFRTEMRFSSHPAHTTALRGEAIAPLSVSPTPLVLKHAPDDPQRWAEAKIANNTDAPQTVTLQAGEGMTVSPESLTVPPAEAVSFQVKAAEGNVAPIEGAVKLATAEVAFDVPVQGAVVKPVLRTATRELRLEPPAAGGRPAGTVVLENVGGAEGYWRWELLAPFMTLETEVRLAPGAQVTIPIQLEAQASGNYRTMLKITGEQQTLQITVLGQAMLAETSPARKAPAPARAQRSSVRKPSGYTPAATKADDDDDDEDEPVEVPYPYKRIVVQEQKPDRLVLLWLAEQYRADAYQVEMRKLSLDEKRELKIDWMRVPKQKVEEFKGKGVRAELNDLEPGQLYSLRLTVPEEGTTNRVEVGGIEVSTPPKPPLIKVTLLRVLMLVLVIFIALTVWQRRRMARAWSGVA